MSRSCKICWIILAVFFVGNLVVLSLWLTNSGNNNNSGIVKNSDREKAKEQWKQQFIRKLDLDTVQFAEFERLRNEHIQQVISYQHQIDSLKEQLMNQTFSGTSDSAIVKKSINDIAELQKRIEFLNFNHYKKVRAVCRNEEQRLKLDDTFRHWMDQPKGRRGRRGMGPR
nr:hypothetical protein [uncultured Carboxylicivirga sp.]